jgi:hypothetical protein
MTSNSTNFKLPAGICYHPSVAGPRYAVKFMLDGARINLGIFKSLESAINELIDFKLADLEKQRQVMLHSFCNGESPAALALGALAANVETARVNLGPAQTELLRSQLELLHNHDYQPAIYGAESGIELSGISIPQTTVKLYMDHVYGIKELPAELLSTVSTSQA